MRSRWRRLRFLVLGAVAIALAGEGFYRIALYVTAPRSSTVDQFDVYGVGESTMVGEPFDPKVSVPRLLEHMFAQRIGERTMVTRMLAERGAPFYPQAIAFERAVAARNSHVPGVALIMAGHNEGFMPATADSQPALLTALSERSMLLEDLLCALRRRHVLRRPVSFALYEHYLRRVVETARASGLVPILVTMVSNISTIEPNVDARDAAWLQPILDSGRALERQGRYAQARDVYLSRSAAEDRRAALLYYRAAKCEEELGNRVAAREHYWRAVEVDPRFSFGRTTPRQNELVRQLAREYDVPLVDAVRVFEQHSPHAVIGEDVIVDGQHPTLEGYRLLAVAYAEVLSAKFGAVIVRPVADAAQITAALDLRPNDMTRAYIDAGSWLIATSIHHPFPDGRLALAAKRFRAALGGGDDFSATMGTALAQAGAQGMLNSADGARLLERWGGYTQSYAGIRDDELQRVLASFQQFGVDPAIIDQLRTLAASRSTP